MTLMALGAMAYQMAANGTKTTRRLRRFTSTVYGFGELITFFSGFNLILRLNILPSLPTWAIAKYIISLSLSAVPLLIYRRGSNTKAWLFITLALVITACALVVFKPGPIISITAM